MDEVILAMTGARRVVRRTHVQSLWGGYGEVLRVELEGGVAPTAVIKRVEPPPAPRDQVSDARKRRSYDVEAAFYQGVAARCDETCRVAALHGSRVTPDAWWLALEDLDAAGYDVRTDEASDKGLDACLAWLAAFHGRFIDEHAGGLWPIGTYWHLATRREECAVIEDPALRAVAPAIDARLSAGRFQTLVHGDPKEANFCFTGDDARVAAVDFQYVGRGCAMKDVAYLLYGRRDEPADGLARDQLDAYFRHLRVALDRRPDRVDAHALEAEWRTLYPVARLDFCRFLAGWTPTGWRRDERGQRFVREMLGPR